MKTKNLVLQSVVLLFLASAGLDSLLLSATRYDAGLLSGLRYRMIGPSRGGRVTTVTGVPSQPATFYMGSTGGGVWKTTDYGQTWNNISDGYFATASMGAIRVADSDPNVLYAGTGSDGIRSNVITGRGVYKSNDAGKTWTFMGLRDVGQVGAIEIHPRNPDVVFLSALGQAFAPNPERGVYRTKDGGKNWKKILYVSDEMGSADLDFAPDDPNTIYAAMWRAERKPWTIISGGPQGGRIYRSNDGGENWTQLGGGLPDGIVGKIDLAVSRATPERVYALIEAPDGEGGLYRSDNRGDSWELISTEYGLLDRPFYYNNLDSDPNDADVVYVNSTRFFKSEDGGKSWSRRSTPHGDNHDIWINPHDSNLQIQANDGGANVTRDGGATWSTQYNQPTAELYQVAVDDRFPYWVYAGQQDNSTIRVPSLPVGSRAGGPTSYWESVGGCETGPAIPKPGDPDIVYSNCKGRFGRYNDRTGQEQQYYVGAANIYGHNPRDLKYRFQRVSPIHVSPHDPNIVYHASQFLHRSTDDGRTWLTISPDLTANEPDKQVISGSPITRDITGEEFYSTLYAVQESPLERGLIWVGANDGPVHVTRNGGLEWEDVTPGDLPKGGRVQTVEPSPHRAGKAYFASYRYLLGDWHPYIYRTNDYGATWTHLTDGSNGIPADTPTRVIREDPSREGLLYAGTEFGMYISFDDGESWQEFQLNLPVTPVTDIKVYREDLVLSTMGRSFWILDDVTPLHQLNGQVASADAHLYSPREAYRLRYRSGGGGPDAPQYPTAGARIYYSLKTNARDPLRLEILNLEGIVVRSHDSSDNPSPGSQGQQMRAPFRVPGGSRLEKTAGMHQFTWDLRHGGIGGRGQGPMVAPGDYQVRLSSGGWSQQEKFTVLIDPNVARDGVSQADLEAQERLGLDVMGLRTRAQELSDRLEGVQEKLAQGTDQAGLRGQVKNALSEIHSSLITASGRYPTPVLLDQISYLSSMIDRADHRPGNDAYERYDELLRWTSDLESRLQDSLSGASSLKLEVEPQGQN